MVDGACRIIKNGKKLSGNFGTIKEGASFGELALLFQHRERAATIVASMASTSKAGKIRLYRLDADLFYNKITPQRLESLQTKMNDVIEVCDRLSGVNTRRDTGTVMQMYVPAGLSLSFRWTGTMLQCVWLECLVNVSRTVEQITVEFVM